MSLQLIKTKGVLDNIKTKWGRYLQNARQDIKPHYGSNSNIYGAGYSYFNIEDNDIELIYRAVCELSEIVNALKRGNLSNKKDCFAMLAMTI